MAQGPWYAKTLLLNRISQGFRDNLPRAGQGPVFSLAYTGYEQSQPAKFAARPPNAEGPAGSREVSRL